jgi:uncharacterized membrane protein
MLRFLCVLLLLGTSAGAQGEYPRLHDVVGVASDDVLNVRAGPGGTHPVVGQLAPGARGVEVIRADGNWGMVNVSETAGWASLRFLRPRADGDLPNTARLTCGGTEPFWDVKILQGQSALLRTPMAYDPGERFRVGLFQRAYNPIEKWVLQGVAGLDFLSMVVVKTYCDDGMSDREAGFDVTLIVSGSQSYVYSGCCHLTD